MPETRSLPCPLTDEEILARATEAANLAHKRDLLEVQLKSHNDTAKKEIARVEGNISVLQQRVRERSEPRDIEVDYRHDEVRGVVETWRMDTGAVIHSRPMTADELRDARQEALPGIGKRGRKDAH